MSATSQLIEAFILAQGGTSCRFIPAAMLRPEERIRLYCYENKCGCYGKHLACPPHCGTVPEIQEKLAAYRTGILIQYSEAIDVRGDPEAVLRTKRRLHRIVLDTENYLKEAGVTGLWGFVGGSCSLCAECGGYRDEPCADPAQARSSLEASAIDVLALLESLGLDPRFHPDRITWTGMILTREPLDEPPHLVGDLQ